MASTYSSTLNLELQASGENSGTWGTITNNNLQKLESAVKGYVSVAIASTTDSLSATDGSTTDEQSNAIIKLTGTLTGNTTMQCEAVENWYMSIMRQLWEHTLLILNQQAEQERLTDL